MRIDTNAVFARRFVTETLQEGVKAIRYVNKSLLKHALHTIKSVTLDIDATLLESQNQSAQWTYQSCKGYMPIVGHIAETGQLLDVQFREGNIPPSMNNLGFIHQCEASLPEGVSLSALRIDGAGYQTEILDLKFAIRAMMGQGLRTHIQEAAEDRWQPLLNKEGVPIAGESTSRLKHMTQKSQHNPFYKNFFSAGWENRHNSESIRHAQTMKKYVFCIR